jgi:hypothetical protein
MSTATDTRAGVQAPSPSLASSAAFKTFALVFALATPVIYVVSEMQNWPLFTYHPGTDRVEWLYAPAVRNEGPAMYWYGWIATTLIGSGILGILATMMPERIARKIPLSLTWVFPVVAVPILIYALRFFWRWE